MEGFEFEAPEEAPIFTPTKEEFENPLQYILKIQPQAQKFGICKIKPPSSWLPPFTMNVDNITFTPRVQKLNELEAKNRIKLNFMNQVSKFWELQGNVFKLPVVDGKGLDLYALHRCFQKISLIKDCKNFWAKVAKSMGYTQKFASSLKAHYENILLPFDNKVLKKVAKKVNP